MLRLCGLMVLALLVADIAQAQYPTYQRTRRAGGSGGAMGHSTSGKRGHYPPQQHHHRRDFNQHGFKHSQPQISGSFFQRPYPYHLDYYRMRWGGSYAPYFGNLYGPPNVVLGAPYPYYGGGFQVPYETPQVYAEPPMYEAPSVEVP